MHSRHSSSCARPATVGILLAGAALFLGACSTPSVVREPGDKSVTYAQLHKMMTKLAVEPATGGPLGPIAELAPSFTELGRGRTLTLAANP